MSALYVWTRIFTGACAVARGYLRERGSNEVVWGCPHRHRSRLRTGGKNAEFYARRCAEREPARRTKGAPVTPEASDPK